MDFLCSLLRGHSVVENRQVFREHVLPVVFVFIVVVQSVSIFEPDACLGDQTIHASLLLSEGVSRHKECFEEFELAKHLPECGKTAVLPSNLLVQSLELQVEFSVLLVDLSKKFLHGDL